jgi:hypothetical protein
LRSDLLTIPDGAGGWIGFRDVFEVNGKAVRDRTERLSKLFLEPSPGALAQARRIADESSRLNIAPELSRTINLPLLALQFIRSANQGRCSFTDGGTKAIDGIRARIIRFVEEGRPRMITTVDDAAASGRFWIEPVSGRIMRTELFIDTGPRASAVSSLIRVTFAAQSKLNAWLPVSMDETYRSSPLLVEGHARYSKFRRFAVETDIIVKAP